MKNEYLDLMMNDTEKLRRVKRFRFREWLVMVSVVGGLSGLAIFGMWHCPVEEALKISLTILSVIVLAWAAWDTSSTWRNPKLPENFLNRIRKAGQ